MSIEVLDRLLEKMGILIWEEDKERLYDDIRKDFSLIGSIDECKYLEEMLRDRRTKKEIEKYVRMWIRNAWSKRIEREEKRKEKMEIYA
jgi:hypothetical protein